jgi:type II secretory pathway component PulJ
VHLADLLTALAIAGLVLSATVSVFLQGQRAYAYGTARLEAQQSARVALARMVGDIRQAGAGGGAFSPIALAESARLVLQQDLDANGVIAARGETVTWLLSGSVLRRNAGGGAQPIVNGVRALTFTCLDAGGLPTTIPAAVRAVAIRITIAPEHPGAGGATATTLATEVRLRNRR